MSIQYAHVTSSFGFKYFVQIVTVIVCEFKSICRAPELRNHIIYIKVKRITLTIQSTSLPELPVQYMNQHFRLDT